MARALDNPNRVQLLDKNRRLVGFADVVSVPRSLGRPSQWELYWRTELNTASVLELISTVEEKGVFVVQVTVVKEIFNFYFKLQDITFSQKGKQLVEDKIEKAA